MQEGFCLFSLLPALCSLLLRNYDHRPAKRLLREPHRGGGTKETKTFCRFLYQPSLWSHYNSLTSRFSCKVGLLCLHQGLSVILQLSFFRFFTSLSPSTSVKTNSYDKFPYSTYSWCFCFPDETLSANGLSLWLSCFRACTETVIWEQQQQGK